MLGGDLFLGWRLFLAYVSTCTYVSLRCSNLQAIGIRNERFLAIIIKGKKCLKRLLHKQQSLCFGCYLKNIIPHFRDRRVVL